MAPIDRRGEGLLAGGGTPRSPDQKGEPVVEPGHDLPRGERSGNQATASSSASGMPSRRRHIVLTAASLDASRVNPGRTRLARSRNRTRASSSSSGGTCTPSPRPPRAAPGWSSGPSPRRRTAAAPPPPPPRPPGPARSCPGGQEHPSVPELHRQRPQRAPHGPGQHPDRRRGDLGDLGGIGDRLELDPPHAVRPPLSLIGGDLSGEPGLARATDAGERHQPPPTQQGRPGGRALQVSAANPRYFTAAAGDTADQKAVYLTGSHIWNNLHDGMGPGPGLRRHL